MNRPLPPRPCPGRVFKYKYHEDQKVSIYVSFGGLLMCIRGHQMKLVNVEPDSRVYLLLKRLKAD